MTSTAAMRTAVTDDEKSSSSDSKRVQYATKFSQAHYELVERFRITFASPKTFFPFRCILEHCVRTGIEVPGIDQKDLRTPRISSTKTSARAATDLYNYAAWLTDHIRQSLTAKRPLRFHHATRLRLITRLARWSARDAASWKTAPVSIDASAYKRSAPQTIFVPLVYDDAVKQAAAAAGSFADLARTAMDAFAEEHEFTAPGTLVPTFQRFPAPPLVTIQRSLEEPVLAILYAMHILDSRPKGDDLSSSAELDALLDVVVRMAPGDPPLDDV